MSEKNRRKRLQVAREAAANGQGAIGKRVKPPFGSNQFFVENNPQSGISTKLDFGRHIDSLNNNELKEFDEFLTILNGNQKLDFGRGIRYDQFGQPYYWVTYRIGRISQSLKLVVFDGLPKLIEISGQYHFDLSLDSLFHELDGLDEPEESQDE